MKPHTGSVVAHNKKDRDTVAQNPTESKYQLDPKNSKSLISDKQKDLQLEQEIKAMFPNVEGLSKAKM